MGASVVDKNPPFSTPTKPLTSSVEAKENRFTSSCLENQMKSSTKKNFMSPTISAASKVVSQRKKILVERNTGTEAAEPACVKLHRRRSSSFDLKQHGSVDLGSSIDSLTSGVSEIISVEDGEDAGKLKPYDPVLNYCSPRPKFLLYKPDRRSEILRRYETIDVTSSESETGSEEESLMKQSVEITEEAIEEMGSQNEEVVIQQHEDAVVECNVKSEELCKKLEEHDDINENIQDIGKVHEKTEELKEVQRVTESHNEKIREDSVHEPVTEKDPNLASPPASETETRSTKLEQETCETKCEALQTNEDNETGLQSLEIEDEDEEGEFEDEGEVERYWSFKGFLKLWLVIFFLGLSTLYISSMNSGSVGLNGGDWKVRNGLGGAPFVHENVTGYVIQSDLAKIGFQEASHRIQDEIIVIKESLNDIDETIELVDEVNKDGCHVEVLDEASYPLTEISTPLHVEDAKDEMDFVTLKENVAACDTVIIELVHVEETTTQEVSIQLQEIETDDYNMMTEVVELHSKPIEAAFSKMDGLDDANHHSEVTLDETIAFEELPLEEFQVREDLVAELVTENLDKVEEVSEIEYTPVLADNELLMRYLEKTDKAVIVGVVSSVLLAVIGILGFRKLTRNNQTLQEEAAVVKKFDNFAYSRTVADDYNSRVGAPRVELLGEYTVGEKEVSSYSLRTNSLENYNDSTYSFSQRNMKNISTSQPAVSGFSSTTGTPCGEQSFQRRTLKKEVPTSSIDSPSYGSFTTEMIYRKKEEARGGEKIVVTPVRRSSRIQSRMTPGASQ